MSNPCTTGLKSVVIGTSVVVGVSVVVGSSVGGFIGEGEFGSNTEYNPKPKSVGFPKL